VLVFYISGKKKLQTLRRLYDDTIFGILRKKRHLRLGTIELKELTPEGDVWYCNDFKGNSTTLNGTTTQAMLWVVAQKFPNFTIRELAKIIGKKLLRISPYELDI
jgi:hypothetical protein